MEWRGAVRALLERPGSPPRRIGLDVLEHDWTFRPSTPDNLTRVMRIAGRFGRMRPPAWASIAPVTPRDRWILYFVFLPPGGLHAAHRFTLARLRTAGAGLAVICAAPAPQDVPPELGPAADALYWKAPGGFDFSAYAIGLSEIAERSPGADVLVMNDSVFGPFVSPDELWPAMRWDLTGFTAFGGIENHVQSYAFFLHDWTPAKLSGLGAVLSRGVATSGYRDTVYTRESRLAAIAARIMSVGAFWYADNRRAPDPSVFAALPLLDAGFPFLKRSVMARNARFYDQEETRSRLRERGHPLDNIGVADQRPVGRGQRR